MITTEKTFETFAQGLVPSHKRIDPETLRKAKDWYKSYAGAFAVTMNDNDLVEIYQELH